MNKIIKYKVKKEDEKIRLDKYISEKNEDLSRAMIQKLIKENKVLVNGNISKESYKVAENDDISLEIEPPKETKIIAENIPLEIIYEDNDILIVNKPKGMVVHPGAGNHEGTLVNAILAHCKDSLSGIGGIIRPGIVHRIDNSQKRSCTHKSFRTNKK